MADVADAPRQFAGGLFGPPPVEDFKVSNAPRYTTTVHMCVDIEGVLRWSDRDLAKLFTEDGAHRSGAYVRDWLRLQLAQGKRVLPMGKCEGFDYQTGCPGHPIPSTNYEANQIPASDGKNAINQNANPNPCAGSEIRTTAKLAGNFKMNEWINVNSLLPESGKEVETKIDDLNGCRNVQRLKFQNNLWWFPDMSMYVYYSPTHWRPI
jgi:hypothetical protein